MAKWVSIAPSLYTVWDVEIVNASTVSRGGGDIASHPQQVSHRHIFLCIRCPIRNRASHITIEMLLSPFISTLRYQVAAGSHNLFRSLFGWLSTSMSLTDIYSVGRVGVVDAVGVEAGWPRIL